MSRLMCERRHGPPPTSLHEAGHTCPAGERDNCVNPHHLEWQTREENEQHKQRDRKRGMASHENGHYAGTTVATSPE